MPNIVNVLFKPFRAGALSLKNRIAMAPAARAFSPGLFPGQILQLITVGAP